MKQTLSLALLVIALAVVVWLALGRNGTAPARVEVHGGHPAEPSDPAVRVTTVAIGDDVAALLQDGRRPVTSADPVQAARLVGTVVAAPSDAGGGQPLTNVLVLGYEPPLAEARFRATTDEQGRFELTIPEAGKVEVTFRCPPWSQMYVENVRLRPGLVTRVDVALHLGHTLVVHVAAPTGASSAPVEGASVTLFPASLDKAVYFDSSQRELRGQVARTDASGTASLPGIDAGPHYLVVSADGYRTWMGDVELPGADSEKQVQLGIAGTVLGTVHASDGGLAAGAWLFITPEKFPTDCIRAYLYPKELTRSDGRGAFRFDGVPAGRHYLAAVIPSGEVALLPEPVVVAVGSETRVELDALAGAQVDGRVVDQDGKPLAGAKVYVSATELHPDAPMTISLAPEASEAIKRSTTSDSEGRFSLSNVRTAAARVKLVGSLDGYLRDQVKLELAPGEHATSDLRLLRLDRSISGRLLGIDGEPMPGIAVGLDVTDGEPRGYRTAVNCGPDGAFRFDLPSAVVTARVAPMLGVRDSRAYEPDPEAREGVRPGASDLEFVLRPRLRLRGYVADADGNPVRRFELHLFTDVRGQYREPHFVENDQGAFDVPFDPEEDLYLKVIARGFQPFELWELEKRAQAEMALRLQPLGAALQGTVLDHAGAPLAGAFVMRSGADPKSPFPSSSNLAPVAETQSDGSFLLSGVAASDRATLLVAPCRADLPPLVRFRLQEIPPSDALVLRLPVSAPVTLELHGPDGNALDGAYAVTGPDGTLDPRIERALASTVPRVFPRLSELGPEPSLSLHLAPGSYRFLYRARGAAEDAVDAYEFTVVDQRSNRFVFRVEN